jgi:hypothetical protein
MIRISFSAASTRAIVARATDEGGRIWCERCGEECRTRADYEIDHCVAEGARSEDLADRPPLSAEDGKLLCIPCHDKKTRRDVREIAKSKRLEEKHRPIEAGPSEVARRYGVRQEPHR